LSYHAESPVYTQILSRSHPKACSLNQVRWTRRLPPRCCARAAGTCRWALAPWKPKTLYTYIYMYMFMYMYRYIHMYDKKMNAIYITKRSYMCVYRCICIEINAQRSFRWGERGCSRGRCTPTPRRCWPSASASSPLAGLRPLFASLPLIPPSYLPLLCI